MNIQTTVNIQSCTYTCAVSCFIKKLYQFKCCGHLYFYFVFPPLGSTSGARVSVLWLSPLKPSLVIVFHVREFSSLISLVLQGFFSGYLGFPPSTQLQGVPKKTESNFKFRLFKDDLIV